METTKTLTHADSKLAELFRSYFTYHKAHPDESLNDETEITLAFYAALSSLDAQCSPKEYILSIKSDFCILSKVLEKFANQASKDIRKSEGIRDKYSITDTHYTVPEIEARWVISGTAVRKAIAEKRLRAKEASRKRNKYLILKEDFENYAAENRIRQRENKSLL